MEFASFLVKEFMSFGFSRTETKRGMLHEEYSIHFYLHNLHSTPVSKAREITLYCFRKPTIFSKPGNDFKSTFHEL